MSNITETPLPYYAVIFSAKASEDQNGYTAMVQRLHELATEEPGFLGMESAGVEFEITVSYWVDEAAIKRWKDNSTHKIAQELGINRWYDYYRVRIAKVERDYGSQ